MIMDVSIPILEYHDLGPEIKKGPSFHSPYVLDPHKFYNQLQWLHENGFQTISIDDLFNGGFGGKSVILTFDDGHISNYEHAFPLLSRFNFKATFFLVANFIGTQNYLSKKHISQMQADGMHFGSHSVTHRYLLSLNRKDMEFEIMQSKVAIEKIIEKTVNHFCIPFGFYNKDLIQYVKDAGYRSAVTERIGYYIENKSPFKILPRFTVKSQMTQIEFVHIMRRKRVRILPRYFIEGLLNGAKKFLGYKKYIQFKSMVVRVTGNGSGEEGRR